MVGLGIILQRNSQNKIGLDYYFLVRCKSRVGLYFWYPVCILLDVAMFEDFFVGCDFCKSIQSHFLFEIVIYLPSMYSFEWPCIGYIFAVPLWFVYGKIKGDLRWVPPGEKWLGSSYVESVLRALEKYVCSPLVQVVLVVIFCSERTCLILVDSSNLGSFCFEWIPRLYTVAVF